MNLLPTSAENPKHDVIYYLRTFALTSEKLRSIISGWELEHKNYDKMNRWTIKIKSLKDSMVYIRYVGRTERQDDGTTCTGYDRKSEDPVKRLDGIYDAFVGALCQNLPHRLDAVKVYESLMQPYGDNSIHEIQSSRIGSVC